MRIHERTTSLSILAVVLTFFLCSEDTSAQNNQTTGADFALTGDRLPDRAPIRYTP